MFLLDKVMWKCHDVTGFFQELTNNTEDCQCEEMCEKIMELEARYQFLLQRLEDLP